MRYTLVLIAALLAARPAAAAEPPAVVASIRPVQAIAVEVMKGVGAPQLLLASASSLHAHSLKPSEAKLLSQATVVFWVAPWLEAFLEKPLVALAGNAAVVRLIDAPGVETLVPCASGIADNCRSGTTARPNAHIWLDPRNAVAMANRMAEALATADPNNAEAYWANAEAFSRAATAMDKDLHLRLAPVRNKPFVVFHDATQYFESRYRLASIGSVSVDPEQPLSARRLAEIQDKLREVKAVCIFSEPQFEPKAVQMLADSTGARTGVLDPEGTALAEGPGLYFTMMRGLADELLRCLA